MNLKPATTLLFFCLLWGLQLLASDTTRHRLPAWFSISAGYVHNSVFGSMVNRNKQFDETVQQKNGEGYVVQFHIEKSMKHNLYFSTGLGFVKKQVKPQENSGVYYKDQLNTRYVFLPLLWGINLLPAQTTGFNFSFEFGVASNFRLLDNSYFGPDRMSTRTDGTSLSLLPGIRLIFPSKRNARAILHYSFSHDISNSYTEHLYWGSYTEPIKKFVYRYNTQMLSLEIRWLTKRRR